MTLDEIIAEWDNAPDLREAIALATDPELDRDVRAKALDCLVPALAYLREQRMALATVEAAVERAVAQAMPHSEADAAGYRLTRHSGDKRTWDTEALTAEMALRHALAAAGGDIDDPAVAVGQGAYGDVYRDIAEVFSIGYARIGVLKARGINPFDFCLSEKGRATVKLDRVDG